MEDRQNSYVYRNIDRVKKLIEENHFRLSKFGYGDVVVFKFRDEFLKGRIEIIDRTGGGFYDGICPSFDIFVDGTDGGSLYKHIPITDVKKAE